MLRRVTIMEIRKERKERGEKWIQHYSSSHKILLVGEGDFSFSASIAKALGSATNMVATSHDSKVEMLRSTVKWEWTVVHHLMLGGYFLSYSPNLGYPLVSVGETFGRSGLPHNYASQMLRIKHWSSEAHLEELNGLGCMVLHNVDVHDMNKQPILKTMKFDRIVFNFPHAGHIPFFKERDTYLIEQHKNLLSGFFQSARKMLTDGGEVHVAHRNDYPYNHWKLEKLAKRAGLVLKECVEFRKSDYPGYHNKRGGRIKSNQKFPLKECFTFKFSLRDSSTMQESGTSINGCDDVSEALSALSLHF